MVVLEDQKKALRVAATENDVEAIQQLVQAGVPVDAAAPDSGNTPLMSACAAGCARAVGALLAAGADPTAQSRMALTSLHAAMLGDDAEACASLILEAAGRWAGDEEEADDSGAAAAVRCILNGARGGGGHLVATGVEQSRKRDGCGF